ncbi:MAG TPA: hypothetical protein VNW97_19090 [Candidatus Saccharimonadales bacterium]|nr:hypothetical protein [Candidatus Saccharimonadales bacterium]
MKGRRCWRALSAGMSFAMMAAFLGGAAAAQRKVEEILDGSFRATYNLQFDEALRKAEEAKGADKDDPVPWVAQGCVVLFREFDRLNILRSETFASNDALTRRPAYRWLPSSKQQFDQALAGAERIAKQRLVHDKSDPKGLFGLAMVEGLRGLDSALITKHNLAALSYIKSSGEYADRLLALSPGSYDAYVGTGLGKYIIGGNPAPVRWILRLGGIKGDQEQGLKELSLAARHGRYLAPYAQILLAFDDLRHKNKAEARKKFEALHKEFPANPRFVEEIAKCDGPGQ